MIPLLRLLNLKEEHGRDCLNNTLKPMAKTKKTKPILSSSPDQELADLRVELRSKFGERAIKTHLEVKPIESISTGILGLDRALGGGIPLGRMIELVGNSGAGKTTIILSAMIQAQKKFPDKIVVYIDAEHALDIPWAAKVGIDLSRFDHVHPEFAEDALTIMEKYASSGKVSLIGLDSVPALLPSVVMEGDIGDANIGKQALLIAQEMQRLGSIIYKNENLSVLLVNQKRAQLASRGGFQGFEPTKATGGMALPFYMTTRLEVYRSATIKNSSNDEIGQEVTVYVKKNKVLNGPGARVAFDILNSTGIDTAKEILKLALEKEKIVKAGAWFKVNDEKFQGEEAVKQYIRENLESKWVKEWIS